MKPPWLPPDMSVWHCMLFLAVLSFSVGVFVVLNVVMTHVTAAEQASHAPAVEYDYGEEWEPVPAPAVKVAWLDLPALAGLRFRHIRQEAHR